MPDTAAPTNHPNDALDARRWRALLAACPRLVGSAGLTHAEDGRVFPTPGEGGYIHAGIEFWTSAMAPWHDEARTSRGKAVLTAIADRIIAQGGRAVVAGG